MTQLIVTSHANKTFSTAVLSEMSKSELMRMSMSNCWQLKIRADVSRCEKMLVDMRKFEQLDVSRYEKWRADMS